MPGTSLKKTVDILLFLTACGFLLLLAMLAYFDRPASDDYQFIAQLHELGFAGSLKFYSQNWSLRWAGLLGFNTLFSLSESFSGYPNLIFTYYLVSWTLLSGGTFLLLRKLLSFFFEELPSAMLILSMSVLFCASLYFITVNAVEVWFWILASFIYLQPFLFTVLGVNILLSRKHSWLAYISLLVCFLIAGGGLESYALLVLGSLILAWLMLKRLKAFPSNMERKIVLALAAVSISLGINVTAPGTVQRKHAEQNRTSQEKQAFTKNGARKLAAVFAQKRNISFLVLPWLWLGYCMRGKRTRSGTLPGLSRWRLFWGAAGLVLLLSLIAIAPLLYAFHSLGPERCLFPVSLLLNIFFSLLFFKLGSALNSTPWMAPLCCALLLVNLFLFAGILRAAFHSSKEYAVAYDQRIDRLLSLEKQGNKELIRLSPLPDPGPALLNGDIMVNSVCFPQALKIRYKVLLQPVP